MGVFFLAEAVLGRAFLKGAPKDEEFFAEDLEGMGIFAEAGCELVLK